MYKGKFIAEFIEHKQTLKQDQLGHNMPKNKKIKLLFYNFYVSKHQIKCHRELHVQFCYHGSKYTDLHSCSS